MIKILTTMETQTQETDIPGHEPTFRDDLSGDERGHLYLKGREREEISQLPVSVRP